MSTLLLRLAGPMQSWGTQSRFTVRDAGLEPSKSGVIGLLCAALGRPREAKLGDLTDLRLGVRVDRPGVVKVDYHTTGGVHRRREAYGVARADGSSPDTVLSQRYYLADASFLVGLEGDDQLLGQLDEAVDAPVWPLFLGRKAFVPGDPIRVPGGLRPESLTVALRLLQFWPDGHADGLRAIFDAPDGTAADLRADIPLSFETGQRKFASRNVMTTTLAPPEGSA